MDLAEYIPLVNRLAHRIAWTMPHWVRGEDLLGSAYLGLWEAAERYDETNPASFKTFATYRIRGAIFDQTRAEDWSPRSSPGQFALMDIEYEQTGAPDEVGTGVRGAVWRPKLPASEWTTDSTIEGNDTSRELAYVVGGLPLAERLVISLYYFDRLSMKATGKALGVCESRASQIHGAALHRLRKRATKDFGVSCADSEAITHGSAAAIDLVADLEAWKDRRKGMAEPESAGRVDR